MDEQERLAADLTALEDLATAAERGRDPAKTGWRKGRWLVGCSRGSAALRNAVYAYNACCRVVCQDNDTEGHAN